MKLRKLLIVCFILQSVVEIKIANAQNSYKPWYISQRSGVHHVDLNGTWELSYMDATITDLTQLANRSYPFITTIPNSVQWSLYKAGKLPHPYYHKNSDLYSWTDEKAWYYSRNFEVSDNAKGNYVFMCFDGLDYFSRVWVNDSLISVHEGMFGGPNVEISRLIKFGARNKVIVEILAGNWGNKAGYNPIASGRIIKPWVISGGTGGEAFFSLGMWQGVRLEIVPKVHLERPYLVTKEIRDNEAKIHLSTEIFVNAQSLQYQFHPWNNTQIRHPGEKGFSFMPFKNEMVVVVDFYLSGKKKYSKEFPIKTFEGRNWLEEDIILQNPKLWNPNGLGEPNLYSVKISLKNEGAVTDKIEFTYGIRTIQRLPSAGPRTGDIFENWQFVVNGRKVFVKGMNFTPQDVLLETSEERYRWTLSAAKKMGVQLIRIWGGGLLETNTLYKLCNEFGIMVWQDFPIGNQDAVGFPQDIWEAQVVQNIFRLRNNPSLVVWCGGNEFNPYSLGNAASIGIIERDLKIFDPGRLFVRSSPDAGTIHTYPDMDPCWYDRSFAKEAWISETGMHSMPEAGLFYEVVDSSEFIGLGRMWDKDFGKTHPEFIHHFTEYGPSRVPRMLSRASHIADMSDPSIESVTEATQIGAGEFYQILSEKVQSNYPITTGLMPWVFKRHWPVIAIQMMDWFGQAAAPYYFLKRTYEPIHISVDLPRLLWAPGEKIDLNIKVINVLEKPSTSGYKASIAVYDDNFHQIYKNEKSIIIKRGTSVSSLAMDSYAIPADYKDRFLFLLAELFDKEGKLISRSYYYPRCLERMEDKNFHDKYVKEPVPWITLDKGPWLKPTVVKSSTSLSIELLSNKPLSERESEIKVRIYNKGKKPAFMTTIDVSGVKRSFYATDNFMWLQTGESKVITVNLLWREKKNNAFIDVSAWNAPTVKTILK